VTQSVRLTAALADRYRLERELGRGGMATVYLAQDVRHDRLVALKVLKPELAAVLGAERFVQEIKTTAALQHPHILPLFDSGTAEGFLYYVMPYIQGETLRAKLDRETQLGIDESVRITTSVADALDYAHRHGVIHRDIKPENILLHDGRPMVADFGIALALSAAAGGRMTETGMSLGTPHYMSPEQATADKELTGRSDIYSLGSVLYEMLTGNPPHTGSSAQQIIMKIVTEEAAPVTKLRKAVPANVAAAVAQSIERLPADRFESAAAFADALRNPGFRHGDADGAASAGAVRRVGPRWRDPLVAALATGLVLAAAAAVWALRRPAPAQPLGWYAVALDSTALLAYRGIGEPARLALTPDGRTIVYVGNRLGAPPGGNQLYVRPLGSLTARALPGTLGAARPSVSPDGSQVAFVTGLGDALRLVPLSGGPALTLTDSAIGSGPAWGPDGFVYYLNRTGTVFRVSAGGGPSEKVVQLPPPPPATRYASLVMLPDGHGALVGAVPTGQPDDSRFAIRAVDLATGRLGAVVPGLSARYVAQAKALVYVSADGSLMAVPFDPAARVLRGRPQAIATGVSSRQGETDLDFAGSTLVYALQGRNGTEVMAWVNRAGGPPEPVDTAWTDTEFEAFALSPDGSRAAITIGGGGGTGSSDNQQRYDVWIKELDRGPISRLTFTGEENGDPSWSGDGKYVSYASTRGGRRGLWRRRADGVGDEERVADVGRAIIESRWSTDGAWLVVSVAGPPSTDIMAMHIGVDSILRPLLAEPASESKPALSADGHWLAYTSNESGVSQVFVRPFPAVQAGKWQISLDGATDPLWSADGRELFFRSLDGDRLFVADMSRGPGMAQRQPLMKAPTSAGFEVNAQDRMFEVSRDGRRFLLSVNANNDMSGDLVVMQNFIGRLREVLAARQSPAGAP